GKYPAAPRLSPCASGITPGEGARRVKQSLCRNGLRVGPLDGTRRAHHVGPPTPSGRGNTISAPEERAVHAWQRAACPHVADAAIAAVERGTRPVGRREPVTTARTAWGRRQARTAVVCCTTVAQAGRDRGARGSAWLGVQHPVRHKDIHAPPHIVPGLS